jgi:TonB family protein
MPEHPGLAPTRVTDRGPALLVPWTPWHRVFLANLGDLLLRREPPPLRLESQPAQFWPDVFVRRGPPWRHLGSSALYHIFFAVVVWGFSVTWLQRPPARVRSPFDNSKITYYSVSEYLPEIETGSASEPPQKKERKGEPAYARQRIVSRPPRPDNFHQTIITPSPGKLPYNVPLPNIVAWTPLPMVPEAAIRSQLAAPVIPVSPVPPPDTRALADPHLPVAPTPEAVAPAPSAEGLMSKLRLPGVPAPEVAPPPPSTNVAERRAPQLPEPAVIEPPVSAEAARRPLRQMNVAHLDPTVAAPKLPVAEQRAAMAASAGGSQGGGAQAAAPAVQPAPSLAGLSGGGAGAGQLIGLSVDPAPVRGPINVPAGSRHGEFAATPEGKPGASGTPEIKGGGTINGNGATDRHTLPGPPGISVSPGPASASATGPVVSGPPAPDPAPHATKPTLMASLARSRVSDLARATRPGDSVTAPSKIEEQVFAGKKYYSMSLNMPNLASAGGSWIIRFAELHDAGPQGELSPPVATLKVDPAYPAEALRERVEGTVTLFAVIRKDGTVGEVKVLQGVDQRLDENAKLALSRWRFRPATKNGAAVDLEAVVKIPFLARKLPF